MNNFAILAFATAIAVAGGRAMAAGDHTPKHGGIVVETRFADLEIVVRPDVIQIYVQDHGKAMSLAGAKAKVTLLNGTDKSEVELAVAGDKLEAKGAFKAAKGTKGIAVVSLPGKSGATARFELK